MTPIKLEDLKTGMIILEEDSYGNNVFKVLCDPYIDAEPGREGCMTVKVKDVQSDLETELSYSPEAWFSPSLYQILPSAG